MVIRIEPPIRAHSKTALSFGIKTGHLVEGDFPRQGSLSGRCFYVDFIVMELLLVQRQENDQ